jgi:hypothetical protein
LTFPKALSSVKEAAMVFTPTTLLFAVGTLFTLSAAIAIPEPDPTVKNLNRQACQTQAPTTIDILVADQPSQANLGMEFTLSRIGDNPPTDFITSAITFENIPNGATGCMFELVIPILTEGTEIASGPWTQADFWTTDPWTAANPPTPANPPVLDQFVSTYQFPTGPTTTNFSTVLESNSCSNVMSFFVELSTWQQGDGYVNFINSPFSAENGMGPIGFYMVYNC